MKRREFFNEQRKEMSEIHIFTGPMASGKTTSLLDKLHRYSNVCEERVLLINYLGDERSERLESSDSQGLYYYDGNGVSTHQYGDTRNVILGKYIDAVRVTRLSEIPQKKLSKYNVIGIDEAQFYPDLYDFVEKSFFQKTVTYYISGLCTDSENLPFGEINRLLPLATTFQKMTAICAHCDRKKMVPAAYTISVKPKDTQVSFGGLDEYKPVCSFHFFNGR